MTYQETLDWLFAQLPAYQKIGKSAYKADLSNIVTLANHLGDPHNKFKSIHVAGTNGKGSSSHMLSAILQEAGYSVGLYTSPHLKDFRERIKIDDQLVSKDFVIQFVKKYKSFFEENNLSFFEMTVGMAFAFFAKQQVDIAIIEVGLGGRLDATNIIVPEVSLVTNIGLDHTQFLGNTLKSVAKEKAGIIKKNVPVVVSETQEEVKPVFIEIASKNESQIVFADQLNINDYETDLLGVYQQKNIKGVVTVLDLLNNFLVTEEQIRDGFKQVVNHTGLSGRWQVLNEKPKIICDTAHNVEGLSLTMSQLERENYEQLHIVFGMVSDKDIAEILLILPKNANYYFCNPDSKRALDVSILYSKALEIGLKGKKYDSVQNAYEAAKVLANSDDCIYVGGSTFVVAEIL